MGMRKYVAGTGIVGAVLSGISLLRGAGEQPFTWRVALQWLSWAITFALAIGMVRDIRRASRGQMVPDDSPIRGKESRYYHPRAAK
ncbi:hypothetical protein [Microbacterium sp. Marseille-Q6965]|uniref:hypothetical protein n=1 Tax=Microbacterium sp. Marseille-Q6965 TaxID=2965072 RepID=UPI0021B817F7|nr:hypothetical protein [Microbacterium sp. Marseille-Q6965]